MLDEVDVSFSSGAGGSNYMGWSNAHVSRQLVVNNAGIRDNRPFYINVRTTGKNSATSVMSFGPVVMAHVMPSKGSVLCTRASSGDWTVTMSNFNAGNEQYTYHTLLKSSGKTLLSLPNQACSLRSCQVAIAGSAVAAVTQFTASVHACNLLGVCTDSVSGTCQVPADGGVALVEHVWEASDALQGILPSILGLMIWYGADHYLLDTISDDEDFMESSTTTVLVYFQAPAGKTYEAALVADSADLSTIATWTKVS
jgi:hypothetical protein